MIRAGLLTLLLVLPAGAEAFRAQNRVEVMPVPGGVSVARDGGYGARGMWCAAADHALRVLNAPAAARLYVVRPRSGPRPLGMDTPKPASK